MRAQLLVGRGDVDNYSFTEVAQRPIVHEGEVLIRVGACGINSLDILAREGVLSDNAANGCHPVRLPCIQGSDVVGRIQEVGANVPRRRIGQRVIVYPVFTENEENSADYGILGIDRNGGYAEYVAVPSTNCIEVPAECDLDDAELASLITSGMTAYRMTNLARVSQDDTVVVTGASGGIGVALVQLCKAKGATIIAVCSEEKKDEVLKLGANFVVSRDTADLSAALLERGVVIDCVLDVVAGPLLPELWKAIKKKGRYCCGGTAGGAMTQGLFWPMLCWKELEITGALVSSKQEFLELVGLITKGVLQPCVHQVLALDELPEAQACLKEKQFVGKLVLDCTVPDPIPTEGEFMLKCEEVPSCIEWTDKGAMEVLRVSDTKVLSPSMIPEGATISRGSRLVRVETARGTILADNSLIEKRREKTLKKLFADKPTLFLVFQDDIDRERALSVSSGASSSSAAEHVMQQPVRPRGHARASKDKSARKKKRSASTSSEEAEPKHRESKKARADARVKTVKKRTKRSVTPKRRPAPRLVVRTRPVAPPKKKNQRKQRDVSPSSSPERSESPPKKHKRRVVSASPVVKRRADLPVKKKRREVSQSPEPEGRRAVRHLKLKRRLASESPVEKRHTSPLRQTRRRASPSPVGERRHNARQKQKQPVDSLSPDQPRQKRDQKRRTSKSLEKQRRVSSADKRVSSRVVSKKRYQAEMEPRRVISAVAKKRYGSESVEKHPNPPKQKRHMSMSSPKPRASISLAEKRRATQQSRAVASPTRGVGSQRSPSSPARRANNNAQLKPRPRSVVLKSRRSPVQIRARVDTSPTNASKKVRNALDDGEDSPNPARGALVRQNAARVKVVPSLRAARRNGDVVLKIKPAKLVSPEESDGSTEEEPAREAKKKKKPLKIRAAKPRVELSRRVGVLPTRVQRYSRLSVDRMAGINLMGLKRRERSRSAKPRVTLVRRKGVE